MSELRRCGPVTGGVAQAVFAAVLACCGPAMAETGASGDAADGGFGGVVTLLIENDIFAGVDRQYTNGTYLRYTPGPNELPALGRFIRRQAEGIVPAKEWHSCHHLLISLTTTTLAGLFAARQFRSHNDWVAPNKI